MSLPAELVDSVIDLLGSNRPALKVTSLLSRQWLPRSRHYLFSSILLTAWNKADLKRVPDFLTLISSPIATFTPAVAEISLRIWERLGEYPILSARAILVTLGTHGIMPARLFLDCRNQLRDVLSTPTAFTSSLVHLELDLGEKDYEALGGICSFPLLETLKVCGERTFSDSMLPASIVLPPRLHTLQASNALVLGWILGLDQAQRQIANLGLLYFTFRRQWFHVPHYVESLTFDKCVYNGDDDCGPDLRTMCRLKHLKIWSTLSQIPQLLGHILPQLQLSPARRTLESITLYPPGVESYYAPQFWIHVDEKLADVATYPCLRSIVISMKDAFPDHLSTLGWNCKSMPWVHEHLPRCSDRGLLRFDIPYV